MNARTTSALCYSGHRTSIRRRASCARSHAHRKNGSGMVGTSEGSLLQGMRILIVEDEPLIAMDVQASLHDAGAEIVGVASTVELALQLAEARDIAGAIVGLRLRGRSIRDVIKRL